MTEYIERDKIFSTWRSMPAPASITSLSAAIHQTPAADVAPVRHGKWESVKNPQWPAHSHDKCSVCGWWNTKNALCYDGGYKPGHSLNFCPNCGAKMDGEGEYE